MSAVIVARFRPPEPRQQAIISQRIHKPFVYDAAEDRAYWGGKLGHAINEIEHLEIQANLVGFIRALMAPTGRLQ